MHFANLPDCLAQLRPTRPVTWDRSSKERRSGSLSFSNPEKMICNGNLWKLSDITVRIWKHSRGLEVVIRFPFSPNGWFRKVLSICEYVVVVQMLSGRPRELIFVQSDLQSSLHKWGYLDLDFTNEGLNWEEIKELILRHPTKIWECRYFWDNARLNQDLTGLALERDRFFRAYWAEITQFDWR
jgi:hypothetical protein